MKVLAWIVGVPLAVFGVFLIIAIVSPGAFNDPIRDAERLVAAQMRDAASAEFRNVSAYKLDDGFAVCGEVNGKNGFGGMAGFQPFAYISGKEPVIGDNTVSGREVMDALQQKMGCTGTPAYTAS